MAILVVAWSKDPSQIIEDFDNFDVAISGLMEHNPL